MNLINALPIRIGVYARKFDVKLKLQGNVALVIPESNEIHLPYPKEGMENLTLGFACQSSASLRYGDWKLLDKHSSTYSKTTVFRNLYSVIEEFRVNQSFMAYYRGVRHYYDEMAKTVVNSYPEDASEFTLATYMEIYIRGKIAGYLAYRDLMVLTDNWGNEYLDMKLKQELDVLLNSVSTLKSQEEGLELTDKILHLLANYLPYDDSQQGDESGDESQSGDSQQGDESGDESQSGDSQQGDESGDKSQSGDSQQGDESGDESQPDDSQQGDESGDKSQPDDSQQGDESGDKSQPDDSQQGDESGDKSQPDDSQKGDESGDKSQPDDSQKGDESGDESQPDDSQQGDDAKGESQSSVSLKESHNKSQQDLLDDFINSKSDFVDSNDVISEVLSDESNQEETMQNITATDINEKLVETAPVLNGDGYGDTLVQATLMETSLLRNRLNALVADETRTKKQTLKRGRKVNGRKISRLQTGRMDIFTKKNKSEFKPNSAVTILLDCSGSIGKSMSSVQKAAYSLFDALTAVSGVETSGFAFGGRYTNYRLKSFHENIKACAGRIEMLAPNGSTPLQLTLFQAIQDLYCVKNKKRVMIVLTDGSPDNVCDCQNIINQMQSDGVICIAVGMGSQINERQLMATYGKDNYIVIKEFSELTEQMIELSKRLIFSSL